jgi:hypothetical protein
VRLLNPTQQVIDARLTADGRIRRAERVNLAEESQSEVALDQGQVAVKIEPHQIITLRLGFD